MKNPIAITGMGILSPFGCGLTAFTKALEETKTAIDFISPTELESVLTIAATLRQFDYKQDLAQMNYLSDHHLKTALRLGHRAPLAIQASFIAALEAWYQANLDDHFYDSARIGLIAAGNNTSTSLSYMHFQNYLKEPAYISPSYALHFLDTSHIGYVSELLNIHGEGFCVGGASASGNAAIIQAARLIELGVVDVCLVLGIMTQLSPIELQALRNISALGGVNFAQQPEKACRAFDQQHEGFIPGESSACLILENLATAKKRQAPLYGYYLGGAQYLDANRTSDPDCAGEVMVMQKTLQNAGLSSNDIDYVNAHGTSAPKGDEVELAALQLVFQENKNKVWINSTKGLTGHCWWSAGVVEAIASIIQLNGQFVHGNRNLEDPIDNDFRQNCALASQESISAKINKALSNNFAFGGINTCIALQGQRSSS